MSDENPVPDRSTSEAPGQATALAASMDELLGAVRAAVHAEVASAVALALNNLLHPPLLEIQLPSQVRARVRLYV